MLKKTLFSTVFVLAIFLSRGFAQNVAINADGSPPNPNAILDVQSTNKGVLIPRVSTSARLAIPNTKGLLVYDTTASAFWYNTGAGWQMLSAGTSGAGWGLNGNVGIDTSNFIGPVDKMPFLVKINNQMVGMIDPFAGNVVWGSATGLLPKPVADTPGQNSIWPRNNTVVGVQALVQNSYGDANTAIGANTLYANVNGGNNAAIGSFALGVNTNGYANTAVGAQTLESNITGYLNTAVGYGSMYSARNGNYNTAIGSYANAVIDNLTNATAIGADARVDASNKVRIGNSAVTVIEGQVPFTTPSDGRFKFDVKEDVKGLDFIRQLRPVTYHFDVERFDKSIVGPVKCPADKTGLMQAAYKAASAIRRSGFIAQEVERAAQASNYDFSGLIRPKTEQEHYSLSYESFVVPLVKAVQEQQQYIESLEKRVAELEKKLNASTSDGKTKEQTH